ncbi:MAG: hypothetical protein EHM42_01860 [Planctomycetaceae bacterium]|nr:MAG: hypothetical protein EHM42_01860 [Planctomycetaceae bacterium]
MSTGHSRSAYEPLPPRRPPWLFLFGGLLAAGLLAALYRAAGGDFGQLLRSLDERQQGATRSGDGRMETQDLPESVARLLTDADEFWRGRDLETAFGYESPRVTAFYGNLETPCHEGQLATGPFYCFVDERICYDVAFVDELVTRFAAAGELARAYLVGHLIAHHVQTRQGTTDRVRDQNMLPTTSAPERRRLKLQLELQADYFAGVWAQHSPEFRRLLAESNLEEALKAVETLINERDSLKASGQVVVPESFAEGQHSQRLHWFQLGYDSGQMRGHDPFETTEH